MGGSDGDRERARREWRDGEDGVGHTNKKTDIEKQRRTEKHHTQLHRKTYASNTTRERLENMKKRGVGGAPTANSNDKKQKVTHMERESAHRRRRGGGSSHQKNTCTLNHDEHRRSHPPHTHATRERKQERTLRTVESISSFVSSPREKERNQRIREGAKRGSDAERTRCTRVCMCAADAWPCVIYRESNNRLPVPPCPSATTQW